RVFKQLCIIGLQSKVTIRPQNLFVHIEKTRACQSAFDVAFAWPGVWKCQPDFVDFIDIKKIFDVENRCAKEGRIVQAFLQRYRAPLPDAFAFDVYANVVSLGEETRQPDCIFTSSTR